MNYILNLATAFIAAFQLAKDWRVGQAFELGGARFGVWFFKGCDLSACLPLTSLVLFPLGGLNPFCAGIDDSASRPIPLLESDS